MTSTVTSREFNQNIGKAQRQAHQEPVIITNRGKPDLVLLSYDEYQRITGGTSILEALSSPEVADIDIEFPREPAIGFRDVEFD